MFRWITIIVLSIATISAGVWGYKEKQDKNAILIQAENSYQRAFHELTYNVDLLHDKIGSTLAMNSRQQLSPQLAEIWRITSDANGDVGQLPLTLLPFNKTEEFLYNIGDFAYKTAVRDLEKKPLSEEEIKALEQLHEQSGEVKRELRKVQNVVLKDNLRWMDVQLALATNDETGDNTIVDGFKTVEKSMDGYQESNIETGITTTGAEKEFRYLEGNDISNEKAKEIASQWFQGVDPSQLTITESGKGADVEMITASYHKGDKNGYMDITRKGGHPLTIMTNRDVKEASISLHEASNKAKEYINKLDITDIELVESSQYERVGVFRFVYMKDGVRYYPDAIAVKVALDGGELLGMSAQNYYNNHHKRQIAQPQLSEEEARSKVNPQLEIQQQHLSVVENDVKEQVLCYEFLTTMGDATYRIFINASNGQEEKVETLKKSEMKFDQQV